MNPCPCGWAGDSNGRCRCAADAIARYRARISGPLLDRIDLHLEVPRLPPSALRPGQPEGESSERIRARVLAARERQLARCGVVNAHMSQADTVASCRLGDRDHDLLERAVDALHLSARSMHRILRVARTIADLAGSEAIATAHLSEAIGYRRNDRAGAAHAA